MGWGWGYLWIFYLRFIDSGSGIAAAQEFRFRPIGYVADFAPTVVIGVRPRVRPWYVVALEILIGHVALIEACPLALAASPWGSDDQFVFTPIDPTRVRASIVSNCANERGLVHVE